jgi:hypothetical protein
MKNAANAFSPSCVFALAAAGYSGGFSPFFTLCPVNGTSAGYGLDCVGDGVTLGTADDMPPRLDDATADAAGEGGAEPELCPVHDTEHIAITTNQRYLVI